MRCFGSFESQQIKKSTSLVAPVVADNNSAGNKDSAPVADSHDWVHLAEDMDSSSRNNWQALLA